MSTKLIGTRKRLRGVAARVAPFLGAVTHVNTIEPVIALTFDDGPDPSSTPSVLDVLAHHGIHATFFMLGERAAQHPGLVNRAVEAGHAVGTHGWEHRSLMLECPPDHPNQRAWRRSIISRGADALGYGASPLFRPAYGHQDVGLHVLARRMHLEVIGWNVVANDWSGATPAEISDGVIDQLTPGAIVLWHDALADAYDERFFDRSDAVEALDAVITRSADRFRFVTVPELLRYGPANRRFFYPKPAAGSLPSLTRSA